MRLPLLVSGVPSRIKECAIVRIPKGDWRIVYENWIDSVLELSPAPFVDNNVQFALNESTALQLCIKKAGSETNLNVYIERI